MVGEGERPRAGAVTTACRGLGCQGGRHPCPVMRQGSLVGLVGYCRWPAHPMPTLPPGLTDWLPSGFFTAFLGLRKAWKIRSRPFGLIEKPCGNWVPGPRSCHILAFPRFSLIWYEVKASETRLNKRIDELREDQKASEARQREDLQALRQDMNDGLGRLEAKVDRLIESRLPSSPRQ